ncbi:L-aspartate oxidase [uncultured Allofournierella sp.]|uniref:L-aspartate oxidase n=1 Tax=uncultured Allofournierella sp. TaxID=1940258 RepID=UPI003752D378
MQQEICTQVVIAGTGVAGLFTALSLPPDWPVVLLTKSDAESSDSFLAQGGICMLRDEQDYEDYYQDTMKAGRWENRPASVEQMIRTSPQIIQRLVDYGVEFARQDGEFLFTREGAHSKPRILYYQDITGKEITSKLLAQAKKRPGLTLLEHTTMTDFVVEGGRCAGLQVEGPQGAYTIRAGYTVVATGGIGGLYTHSTNFPHLTGDAIRLAQKHGVRVEHLDYVQFHPTTLYSTRPGRRFLISESVRGEGALLYNHQGKRFVNELLARDQVTQAIWQEMEREEKEHMWLSLEPIGADTIRRRFPNIYARCLEEGIDITRQWVPVVPAQHYFMGGIWVDQNSAASLPGLYAVGETSCNGVHGANRLASNSLLESLVFAQAAAHHMSGQKAR